MDLEFIILYPVVAAIAAFCVLMHVTGPFWRFMQSLGQVGLVLIVLSSVLSLLEGSGPDLDVSGNSVVSFVLVCVALGVGGFFGRRHANLPHAKNLEEFDSGEYLFAVGLYTLMVWVTSGQVSETHTQLENERVPFWYTKAFIIALGSVATFVMSGAMFRALLASISLDWVKLSKRHTLVLATFPALVALGVCIYKGELWLGALSQIAFVVYLHRTKQELNTSKSGALKQRFRAWRAGRNRTDA